MLRRLLAGFRGKADVEDRSGPDPDLAPVASAARCEAPVLPSLPEGRARRLNVRFHTRFNRCNFTCEYCIAGQGDPSDPRLAVPWDGSNYLPIVAALTRLPHPLNVRIGVGGEFFLSPLLIEGARDLSLSPNVESVNLITNLGFPSRSYRRWFADFDRSKLALVASYHPTQVADFRAWCATAVDLAGEVDLCVCMVAHPDRIADLESSIPALRNEGLSVFVQPFIGYLGGRTYPESYTAEEKDRLRRLVFSRHDWEFLVEGKRPGLCNAGHTSIYVDLTGVVRICGMPIRGPVPVGNLLTGEPLRLYDGPRPCTATDCRCDTENMNTEVFRLHYRHTGLNQHRYEYRFLDLAREVPGWGEWEISY